MAGNWKEVSILDIAERIAMGPFGSDIKTDNFVESGVPIIRGGNLTTGRFNGDSFVYLTEEKANQLSNANAFPGDIVFTHRGTLGQVGLLPNAPYNRYIVSQSQMKLSCNKKLADSAFIYYFFKSPQGQQALLMNTSQTGVPAISRPVTSLKAIRLLLPPLPEQKRIAHILGKLDDKIELNRRMNKTLEEVARALFRSWFINFDPVRTKLDGLQPIGLDVATAALFPDHFVHGDHDMLPIDWRYVTIEDVCAINAWTLGKNDDLKTLEYVEISEVSRGNITNIVTYPRGEEPSRARRRLRHGDTILSTVRPDRGSYFLALHPPENRVASTGFSVFTPTKVPWSFLHAALTLPEVSEHLGQMADGGAYPAVRPEIIGSMQVALPNEPKILEAFHRTCAPLFQQAETNRTQSRILASLRDMLLPKLLSGEITPQTAHEE